MHLVKISVFLGAIGAVTPFAAALRVPPVSGNGDCKCRPEQSCWPTPADWNALNRTVAGRLVSQTPLGAPCHGASFDASLCDELKSGWDFPIVYENSTTAIMNPWWQNGTCDPFHPQDTPCLMGNYPIFTVEAETAADIQAALNFAHKKNVRLVVHNTGHDFMGKSSGAGALSIAMKKFQNLTLIQHYTSSYYSGPAVKMSAAIQAYQAYEFANASGYRIFGGDCPTVGLAGGYAQGGGHGSLSSLYGVGSDQVLEWEIVAPNGTHLVATPERNSDFYWAVSGGGGGTFGVVLSMTVRVFPDVGSISGARLTITNSSSIPKKAFWSMVTNFHASLPELYNSGNGSEEHYIETGRVFDISRITAPNWTTTQLRHWLAPVIKVLDAHNATYVLDVTSSPTFYDHFLYYQGPVPIGRYKVSILAHNRLIPLEVISNSSKNQALTDVIRWSSEENPSTKDLVFGCVGQNATNKAPIAPNSVLPAWRDSALSCIMFSPFPYGETSGVTDPKSPQDVLLKALMNDLAPRMRAVTPGSGSYPNEANWNLTTWREDFFGSTWDRLSQFKKQVDPHSILYGIRNVGSEEWSLDVSGNLCRKT